MSGRGSRHVKAPRLRRTMSADQPRPSRTAGATDETSRLRCRSAARERPGMSGRKRGEAGGTAMSSQDSGVGLREEVDDLLAKGDAAGAAASLRRLWREAPSAATAAFVTTRFEQLRGSVSLGVCRLYVARSFTVEPIVPLLRAEAFAEGVDLDVELGAFNAYAQEILDGNSRLYVFSPDVVLLAVQTRDLLPQPLSEFAGSDPA